MNLSPEEWVKEFIDFFDNHKKEKLVDSLIKKKHWLKIQFNEIIKFNPKLADDLLEKPEELIKCADIALDTLDSLGDTKRLKPRFLGLPKSTNKNIWEVRSEDVGKFIGLIGLISKSSDIYSTCDTVSLECKACSAPITVHMIDNEWKEPIVCRACGARKPGWRILNKSMFDNIKLGIADDLMENKDRTIAREKIAILSRDLTSRQIDREIKPGRKVIVNGYFKYKQKIINKQKSVEHDIEFYANSIEFIKVGWETVKINHQEEKLIKALSKQEDIIDRLAQSVSDVKGYDEAKTACLLLQAGAPHIKDKNGSLNSRGTIHILLIGNPGTAKTYLARRFGSLSPIYSFQSAATASGKGLVASVAQDKDIGGWVIYPGVVALCHKGMVVIDEIDKTDAEDYGDHNNAMNDMEVPIARANVKGLLETETSYLATANPENRVFTQWDSFYNQIDMPKDFLDRFDIIFPMVAAKDKAQRESVVNTMLERHLVDVSEKDKSWQPEFEREFIQKYISFCRRFDPKINHTLFPYIQQKLNELMHTKQVLSEGEKGEQEAQHQTSLRHLEGIIRFCYASARLHIRDVSKEDIDLSFELKRQSFIKLGIIDETTGQVNWGKLENIDEQVLSDAQQMNEIVKTAFSKMSLVPIDDLILAAKEVGLDEEEMEKYVAKRKQRGDYFEQKPGFLRKL